MSLRPSKLPPRGSGSSDSGTSPSFPDSHPDDSKRKARSWLPKVCIGIAVILLLPVGLLIGSILYTGNVLSTLVPHHHENCRIVRGPVGAEDIAFDVRGVTFASADTRKWVPTGSRDGITDEHAARRLMVGQTREQQGAIWAYDSRSKQHTATPGLMKKLIIQDWPWDNLPDFHPHGICIPGRGPLEAAPANDDPIYLYAINHARTGDQIAVLRVHYLKTDPKSSFPTHLTFVTMLQSPKYLTTANDLACMYPTEQPDGSLLHTVYVSNFLGSGLGNTIWNMIEMFTRRPWGSVVACQSSTASLTSPDAIANTKCETLIPELVTPNGVALSPDFRYMYVALSVPTDVLVYEMPPSLQAVAQSADEGEGQSILAPHGKYRFQPVKLKESIHTGTSVDNIDIDSVTGDLFIGSHKKLLAAFAHQEHGTPAPTNVIRVRFPCGYSEEKQNGSDEASLRVQPSDPQLRNKLIDENGQPSAFVDEIHLGLGERFSGASTGIWSRQTNELIMGGVSDNGLFICPYPSQDQLES